MYLLDTDTLVYLIKNHRGVVERFHTYAAAPKAISVISFGELSYGAAKSGKPVENGARVQRLAEICPLIPVSRGMMETFGSIKADLERSGTRLDDLDLVIASTAIVLNYTLVTNNTKHFRRIPALRLDNWAASPAV